MPGEVDNLDMATGAAVLAVHRINQKRQGDLLVVTPQTGGGVDGKALAGEDGRGNNQEQEEER
jgi:hypothetical protein